MKKFIEFTAALKSFASIIFAGLIIVYTVFGGFFGLKDISFSLIWQALFIAMIATGLHYVLFSQAGTKQDGYIKKSLLFGGPMFAVLAGFAYFGKWFPAGVLTNWLLFLAVYVFFFGVILIVFRLYFRITGEQFTQALNAYQQRNTK